MKHRRAGAQLEVARIQSEINRLFETLIRLRDGGTATGAWSPVVDVAETGDALLVEVELPGVDARTLELSAQRGQLVLRGTRMAGGAHSDKSARILHAEREYGPFEARIPLGTAVNTHRATARAERGMLIVTLPKVPNRRGEAVPIEIEVA